MLELKTETATNKYKAYRNKLKGIIRRSRIKYLHDKCTEFMSGYHAETPITIKAEAIHEAESCIH